jgi:hypothetical protein
MHALIRACQMTISAAQMLGVNPLMPWDELENLTLYLRLDQRGQDCPSFEQLMQFLSMVPYEHSRQLFMAVRFLIETMTNQTIPFGMVMQSFVKREDECRRRRYVDDDVPPPIRGMPTPSYSCDLWRLLKRVYLFQSSLRPVTLPSVLSSHKMVVVSSAYCDMMQSPSAQYRFYLCCVMHGSNPSLRLATQSPGMFYIFLRKLCENAAESGQIDYLRCIIRIFLRFYGLNPRMLQKI